LQRISDEHDLTKPVQAKMSKQPRHGVGHPPLSSGRYAAPLLGSNLREDNRHGSVDSRCIEAYAATDLEALAHLFC